MSDSEVLRQELNDILGNNDLDSSDPFMPKKKPKSQEGVLKGYYEADILRPERITREIADHPVQNLDDNEMKAVAQLILYDSLPGGGTFDYENMQGAGADSVHSHELSLQEETEEKADEVGETFHYQEQSMGRNILSNTYRGKALDQDYSKDALRAKLGAAIEPEMSNKSADHYYVPSRGSELSPAAPQENPGDSGISQPNEVRVNYSPNVYKSDRDSTYVSTVESDFYPGKRILGDNYIEQTEDAGYSKPAMADVGIDDQFAAKDEEADPGRDILGGEAVPALNPVKVNSVAAKAMAAALVSDDPVYDDIGGNVIEDPEPEEPGKALEDLDDLERKIAELRARHKAKKNRPKPAPVVIEPETTETPIAIPTEKKSTPAEKSIQERLKKFIKDDPTEAKPKVLKEKSPSQRQDPQDILDELAEKIADFKRQRGLQKDKADNSAQQSSPLDRLTHKIDEISVINNALTKPTNGPTPGSKRRRSSSKSDTSNSLTRNTKRSVYYRPEYPTHQYKKEKPPTFNKDIVKSQLRERFSILAEEAMAEKSIQQLVDHSATQQRLLETLSSNFNQKRPQVRNPLIPEVDLRVRGFEHLSKPLSAEANPEPRMLAGEKQETPNPPSVYTTNPGREQQIEAILKPTDPGLPPNLTKSYRPKPPNERFSQNGRRRESNLLDIIIRR